MTIEQQTAEPFTGQKKNISHSLTRLLRPSSIAVIGGKWAEAVVLSCVEVGFKGDIWPVHPHKDMVAGHKAYADLASLPAAPDAVFLGVNRKTSIAMIKELSAMGAGGVVAFASGFAEVEDGKAYQDALIASAGDMAVLGPNCYGMINYLDGALLWPDVHGGTPVERGVAIITQSSNLAINLTMQLGGLPIAYTLTLGNQAMIGMADLIRVVAEDDRVTAIGLHIEGINDAPAFAAAVHDAKARGKNILALKAGLSEAAQNMTISHTASLAGGNAASEAFFDAIGIGIVHSIEEMLGGLSLLHCFGQIDDPSLMTMSCSGGEASLVADAAMRGDVPMPELSEAVTEAIKATVNPLVTVSNPFDYHTFDWGDGDRLAKTFTACMSAGIGITALIIDFPKPVLGRADAWKTALESVLAASHATGAKAIILASMPEGIPS
jgi:acetyl-CoA synthetase